MPYTLLHSQTLPGCAHCQSSDALTLSQLAGCRRMREIPGRIIYSINENFDGEAPILSPLTLQTEVDVTIVYPGP